MNNRLVRSGGGNAVEYQRYRKTAKIPASINQLIAVGISSVDSDGSEHYYGPFELGRAYGDLARLEPIDWSDIRSEVDANMAQQNYVKNRVNGYVKQTGTSSLSSTQSATEVVEFSVGNNGMYRITSSELRHAGVDWRTVRNGDIALIDTRGNAVVRYLSASGSGNGLNKTFGGRGEIYFYGLAADESQGIYSNTSGYRLLLNRHLALDAQRQRRQGLTDGFRNYYLEQSLIEKNTEYVLTSMVDDPWLAAQVLSYADRPRGYGEYIPVEADALVDHTAQLSLHLARSSALPAVDGDGDGVQDTEHTVQGLIVDAGGNVVVLGSENVIGAGEWTVRFAIPPGTPLGVESGSIISGGIFQAGTGYAFSEVQVDAIGLSYARPTVAKPGHDYLSFAGMNEGQTGYEVNVPDTGWPWVFASGGANLLRIGLESQAKLSSKSQRRVKFAVVPVEGIEYWVSGKPGMLTVSGLISRSIPNQANLIDQARGANYLLIAHPAFMGADASGVDDLSNYAAFKTSQGHDVAIINYLDIVDVFGGGQSGPMV